MDKREIKKNKKFYESLVFAIIKRDKKNFVLKEYNVILDLIEYIEDLEGWNLTKELIEDERRNLSNSDINNQSDADKSFTAINQPSSNGASPSPEVSQKKTGVKHG